MSAAEVLPAPEQPALSPSIAHVLTAESPMHAWTIHRLLGNRPKPVTDDQERGRLIHALVLEDGENVEVIDADNFQTKAAREARDAARAKGLIPVCAPKAAEASKIAERIRDRIASIRIGGRNVDLGDGIAEQRIEWTESSEHGDTLCSGQPDWLRNDRQLIIDLKTCGATAHPDFCAATIARGSGSIQDCAYRRAVHSLDTRLVGRVEFVFLFAQLQDPFAVTPIEAAGSMRELGELRWSRAIEVWSRCLSKGREEKHWPSYAMAPVRCEAPQWALAREIGMEGV